MKRITAARAGMVIDINHDLDARQMRRKRSPVHAALGRPLGPFRRIGRFSFGLAARRNLLHLLQAEQHLIFGERLRATTEAMTLQLFDDLAEPIILRPLRNQHRLQRAGIVRERIRRDCHEEIRSCVAAHHELRQRADSLCRNHPGCSGAGVSRAA
jgi:hypothetical protein